MADEEPDGGSGGDEGLPALVAAGDGDLAVIAERLQDLDLLRPQRLNAEPPLDEADRVVAAAEKLRQEVDDYMDKISANEVLNPLNNIIALGESGSSRGSVKHDEEIYGD